MDIRNKGRAVSKTIAHLLLVLLLAPGGFAHAGTVTYVYSDPQGTPLAEADANGNITATFDYRPYGSQALGTAPTGPGYTGHVNDPDTGLVYMQARYYDPQVGRFISADPIGPAAGNPFNFNRFAYVSNDPVNRIDPDGRMEEEGGAHCYSFSGCRFGVSDSSSSGKSEQGADSKKATTLQAVVVTATRIADQITVAAPSVAVRASVFASLYLVDGNNFHDWLYGKQGCYGTLTCGGAVNIPLVQLAKPIPGSKPKNAPPGTLPIDRYPGLSKDDIHGIKEGVGAGARDWTGISPDGKVITGDHNGEPVDHGPFGDYLPGSNP